jgi:hypothetical protein
MRVLSDARVSRLVDVTAASDLEQEAVSTDLPRHEAFDVLERLVEESSSPAVMTGLLPTI